MKFSNANTYKAKIVVTGPCKSGKSVLSNFLGDQMDTSQHAYRPTSGVRILEFESAISAGHIQANIEIELWDCSGNESFESCWTALAAKADGVILVYDPLSQNASSVKPFYEYFVKNQSIKDAHCAVFANCVNQNKEQDFSSPIPSCAFTVTNLVKEPETVKSAFNSLMMKVYGKLSASRERQEESILT